MDVHAEPGADMGKVTGDVEDAGGGIKARWDKKTRKFVYEASGQQVGDTRGQEDGQTWSSLAYQLVALPVLSVLGLASTPSVAEDEL